MNVLIPMAGQGERFAKAGYNKHKPVILVTDRRKRVKIPMVVAATGDILRLSNGIERLIYIDRDFHKQDGVEDEIRKFYPMANFLTINKLTEGQACTCLLAKEYIDNNEELLIAACDNGMEYDVEKFNNIKNDCDVLIFTFKNNIAVEEKPEAYGWVRVDEDNALDVSVKIPISDDPIRDHAVVGAFWFRKGSDFVKSTSEMIKEDDRINGEFYVDQAINYAIKVGLKVKVFEIDKYICWGTPVDYENYESTMKYWQDFYNNETWIK